MTKFQIFLTILAGTALAGWVIWYISPEEARDTMVQRSMQNVMEKPLNRYTIPELRKADFPPSDITIDSELDLGINQPAHLFYFSDAYAPDKKISGSIIVPQSGGTYPAIIMLRGWADEEIYYTGYGTKNAAAYFAANGFITISPDFLGYGSSDPYAENLLEARFQTYTATLTLLKSLNTINQALADADLDYTIDTENISIWGHSNGGQIALAVLEATNETYPTTLWAPVTEVFPQSILHFAADREDGGKLVRDIVAEFNETYDSQLYSPTFYYAWIQAPIQLHQGTADDSVPQEWSDTFHVNMKNLNKDISYFVYDGADHNMRPAWDRVVRRDVEFFNSYFSE